MTMAAFADRPTHRCDPRGCVHLICEGCHLPVCGPDDGWRTSNGRVYVCEPCLERHRRQWMKAEARS